MNKSPITYDAYQCIAVSIREKIATVSLNRPGAMNAVNSRLHEELSRIFYDVADDPSVDVIVLTGSGAAFCAGGDLKELLADLASPHSFVEASRQGKRLIFGLLDCAKPIICRLNGDAIGLGATIALFCDIVVASNQAVIADPHVSIGLVAGDGGAIIWPQLVGYARAKEYLLLGSRISAAQAAEIGLINYCVSPEELDAKVDKLAKQLARGAQTAIQYTKTSINMGLKQLVSSILDASLSYEGLTLASDDYREGLLAFSEGRRPNFGKSFS